MPLLFLLVCIAFLASVFVVPENAIGLLISGLSTAFFFGVIALFFFKYWQDRRLSQIANTTSNDILSPPQHRRPYQWAFGFGGAFASLIFVFLSHKNQNYSTEKYTSDAVAAEVQETSKTKVSLSSAAYSPIKSNTKSADDKTDKDEKIVATIRIWAKAWEARNITEYFSIYSPSFVPANQVSRKEWEISRRQRISSAKNIVIEIREIKVTYSDQNRAEAVFIQNYSASGKSDKSQKTLSLAYVETGWKILSESAQPIGATDKR
jgi:HAMP domain-containing protein